MLRTALRTAAPTATRSASTAAAPAAKRAWTPRTSRPTVASPSRVTPSPPSAVAAAPVTPAVSTPSAQEMFDAEEANDESLDALLPEIPAGLHSPSLPSFSSPATLASTATTSFPSLTTGSLPSTSTVFPMGAARAETPASIPVEQREIDWSTSFHGLSAIPFSEKQADTLMRPLTPNEIEIKPDGLLYLPEILYRRILNKAFGPGGWGMVPRGEMTLLKMMVSREWGLVASGRLVSVARGEQTFFNPEGLPTATEGCKSNALMRCCKDLGIASELWDPAFIRTFKAAHCVEAWTEHASSKKKARRWRKKGNKFEYPYVEAK